MFLDSRGPTESAPVKSSLLQHPLIVLNGLNLAIPFMTILNPPIIFAYLRISQLCSNFWVWVVLENKYLFWTGKYFRWRKKTSLILLKRNFFNLQLIDWMKSIFMRKKNQVKTPNKLYILFNSVPMRMLFDKMLSQNFRNVEGKFESRTCKKLAKIELP